MPAPVAPTIAPTVPPAIPDAERAAFEARLRALQARYHIHHPFNQRMASGQCSRAQIQGWVANRFYYQVNIPLKDAAILSNCPDRATRREWVVRILYHHGNPPRPGTAARMGGAHPRPRWQRRRARRHRSLEPARRGRGADARGPVVTADGAARGALCGRCLRQLCAAPTLAGSRVLVSDRDVRARHPPGTAGRLAAALPLGRSRGSGLFPFAHPAGAARCRAWPARHARALPHVGRAPARQAKTAVPARHPVVDARRDRKGVPRMNPCARPQLDPLYRLQWEPAQQAWVLLYPEGMVKLNDSAAAILQRCDGAHTLDMLIDELQTTFGAQDLANDI